MCKYLNAKPVRAEVTKGALQGTSITYNDYFNESSDEGSYVESSEEVAPVRVSCVLVLLHAV